MCIAAGSEADALDGIELTGLAKRAEAVAHFPTVDETVVIRVGIMGVGAILVLFKIGEEIVIQIELRVDRIIRVETMEHFPCVRHTIAVGIVGGFHQRVHVQASASDHFSSERGDFIDTVKKSAFDIEVGQTRIGTQQKSDGTGDVRGGHGGSLKLFGSAARHRTEDGYTGGGEIDAVGAIVRKRGQFVVLIGCGDGNDVGHVITGGIKRGIVVVGVFVSGGGDKEHPVGIGIVDGRFKSAG